MRGNFGINNVAYQLLLNVISFYKVNDRKIINRLGDCQVIDTVEFSRNHDPARIAASDGGSEKS